MQQIEVRLDRKESGARTVRYPGELLRRAASVAQAQGISLNRALILAAENGLRILEKGEVKKR